MIDKKFIMQRILDYIRLYNMKYNESPSVRNIAEIVDISKSSVQNYLVEMNEKGIVSYENGVISVDLPDGFSAAEHVRNLRGVLPHNIHFRVDGRSGIHPHFQLARLQPIYKGADSLRRNP